MHSRKLIRNIQPCKTRSVQSTSKVKRLERTLKSILSHDTLQVEESVYFIPHGQSVGANENKLHLLQRVHAVEGPAEILPLQPAPDTMEVASPHSVKVEHKPHVLHRFRHLLDKLNVQVEPALTDMVLARLTPQEPKPSCCKVWASVETKLERVDVPCAITY